ncbi:DUF2000 family protein [Paracoccus alkenifer]|uniref:Uncharacterized protein n=1 Tax=Paracoccus alkenifer TaxID=65735 RepID=A0A1H6NHR0_9RHOB|nr:DUF2000 family protein [Paracoccus alkenifer]MCB1832516.1 DUF2000 family protein [Geminicoccaceae bacterium]SEI12526.1 Protein of unknown function [Paracoccus alkenifer]
MGIESVILLLDSLPAGLKANIAAVLGMSLAHYYPEQVGSPATAACGRELPGITTIPVPILNADETVLSEIYLTASDLDLVVPSARLRCSRSAAPKLPGSSQVVSNGSGNSTTGFGRRPGCLPLRTEDDAGGAFATLRLASARSGADAAFSLDFA